MRAELSIDIAPQPDDRTCGATCLHAIYRYFDDALPLERLVTEVPQLESGGTLGVHLANHALGRGYRAHIFTYNLQVFDPSWFRPGVDLSAKLAAQARTKHNRRLREGTRAYRELLRRGGSISFRELGVGLLQKHLSRGQPILTGLSATYLYQESREDPDTDTPDDIGGLPVGHFVVLCGYDAAERTVTVADPLASNPLAPDHIYKVDVERLIGAILLGVVTYDANLLLISPRTEDGA